MLSQGSDGLQFTDLETPDNAAVRSLTAQISILCSKHDLSKYHIYINDPEAVTVIVTVEESLCPERTIKHKPVVIGNGMRGFACWRNDSRWPVKS